MKKNLPPYYNTCKGDETMPQKTYIIDSITFVLLMVYSIAASIFKSSFAETHITLSFVPFPIFIGEILLIITGCLLLIRFISRDISFTRAHLLLLLFYTFIIVKALYGYTEWSALAFRHSALFYYSIFAIISYYAFTSSYLNTRFIILVMTVFCSLILVTKNLPEYYYFPYLVLLFCLAKRTIGYWIICAIVTVITGYTLLLVPTRGILLSFLVTLLFSVVIFFLYFFKSKYKLFVLSCVIIATSLTVLHFGDKETLNIFVSAKKYVSYYKAFNAYIGQAPSHIFSEFTVRLYLDNTHPNNGILQTKKHALPSQNMSQTNIDTAAIASPSVALPVLTGKEGNALWRIFVIRDMLKEVIHDRCIIGADFGKPFRSISIELLNYKLGTATGYWVGWLEPHNSYVHMIYRIGIVAFLFIGAMIFLFIQMVVGFVRLRNIKGILLTSLILYWILLANFEVILELPYFAIPFWSLFGIAYKYFVEKQKEYTALTALQQEKPAA